MSGEFTHFDESGRAKMVEVGEKEDTVRTAIAGGSIRMSEDTLALIQRGDIAKGDVLGVAQTAGIMGAKRTSDLIPMCHPLMITGVKLDFKFDAERCTIEIEARVTTTGKTGVEMEALTAVSTAALTIYDMCKAVDKTRRIGDIRLKEKYGGKSGDIINE